MDPSDGTLIRQTLQGEHAAYQTLVERYRSYVFSIITRRVRDVHQAEDLAQETFIAAYTSLEGLQSASKFKSWIGMIATNLCRMWLRSANTPYLTDFQERPEPAGDESLETIIDEMVLRAEADRLLDVLSEQVRRAILLHYDLGLSYAEVAERTGVSLSTVRSRIQHGRSRLKRELIGMATDSRTKYDLPEGFSANVMQELMERGERLAWDFAAFKHNLSTSNRLLPESWHARIDGKDLLVRKAHAASFYQCEKQVLQLLSEEGFPVPSVFSAFDEDLLLAMEWPEGRNLLEVIHGLDEDEARMHLGKAFEYVGKLEGIYSKRRSEFEELAGPRPDDIPAHAELEKSCQQLVSAIIARCLKLGVLEGGDKDLDALARLWVQIILKPFSLGRTEQTPGILFIYPFNVVLTKQGLVFTGMFSAVHHGLPEQRLFYFCSQPTISRGGKYTVRLNDELVDQYLAGYSVQGADMPKSTLCRNLDWFHTFRFGEGLDALCHQMDHLAADWRFVELAETHGSFSQRARDMVASYLSFPSLSDDELVTGFRQLLTTLFRPTQDMI